MSNGSFHLSFTVHCIEIKCTIGLPNVFVPFIRCVLFTHRTSSVEIFQIFKSSKEHEKFYVSTKNMAPERNKKGSRISSNIEEYFVYETKISNKKLYIKNNGNSKGQK